MKKIFHLALLIIFTTGAQAKTTSKKLLLEKLASGHMVADVTIKNFTSKFIIDTGSTSSVINKALVDRLALKAVESDSKIKGYAPGQAEYSMSQYSVKKLQIGDFLTTDVTFVEQDITAAFAGLTESPIGGILGQEILAAHGLLLDINNSTLSFPANSAFEGYTSIPMLISNIGLPVIELSINQKPVNMIIDSGAGEVMLDQKIAESENFGEIKFPEGMVGYDETGVERQIGLIEQGDISIGGQSFKRHLLVDDFSNLLEQINASRKKKVVGLIGLNVLSGLSALVDIKNQKLYIK